MVTNFLKYSVLALSVSAVLSGCGGGGSGSNNTSQDVTISGKAIDGYLAEATITFDNCVNKPTIKTDLTGSFSFKSNSLGTCTDYSMTVTGGTDLLLKTPFTGSLKIKDDGNLKNKTAVTISPLTTLKASFTGNDEEFKKILTNLGFSAETDITNYDPIVTKDATNEAKFVVLQQLIQNIEQSNGSVSELASEIQKSTTPLFTSGEASLNTNTLNNIISALPTAVTFDNTNLVNLATQLNTYVASSAGSSLTDHLEALTTTDPSTANQIKQLSQNLIKPATYYETLKFAGYTTSDLKAANTEAEAKQVSKSNLLDNLSLKISSNASKVVNDELQLAFELNILGKGKLHAISNSINLNFDNSGNLLTATIPAGTKITLSAVSNGINVERIDTTKVDYVFTPNLNGEITLGNIVSQSGYIHQVYSEQLGKLSAGDIINANVFVKLKNYPIWDSNLPLATVDFGQTADQFTGSSISTYFKLID